MAVTTDQTTDQAEHFDAAQYDEFLATHGTPALWRRARTCPCLDPDTGQASIACAYCRDYPGIVWDAGADIVVLATGRQRRDQYRDAGAIVAGVVTFSFPSVVTPGHLDRIELLAGVMVVNNEIHVRGAVDGADRSKERVHIVPVLDVEYCDAIVGGVLTQYNAGVDFNLDADGDIEWVTSIPDGTRYTLRYTTRPSYICWSPQSRDEGGSKQAYRVVCQRLDFWRRRSVGEE